MCFYTQPHRLLHHYHRHLLLASFIGCIMIGLAYYLGVLFSAAPHHMSATSNQFLIILVSGLGGRLDSLMISILGAR